MKLISILTVLVLWNAFQSKGQAICEPIDTSCDYGPLYPYSGEVFSEGGYDSTTLEEFIIGVDQLHYKMIRSCTLDKEEATFLLKCMNTLYFCADEYSDSLKARCPKLSYLEDRFHADYCRALGCQYGHYWGTGGGIYFAELHSTYTGKWLGCAMFYIPIEWSGTDFIPMLKVPMIPEGSNY